MQLTPSRCAEQRLPALRQISDLRLQLADLGRGRPQGGQPALGVADDLPGTAGIVHQQDVKDRDAGDSEERN